MRTEDAIRQDAVFTANKLKRLQNELLRAKVDSSDTPETTQNLAYISTTRDGQNVIKAWGEDKIRRIKQAECNHLKENGKSLLAGQQTHNGILCLVCQKCFSTFTEPIPSHLVPDAHTIGRQQTECVIAVTNTLDDLLNLLQKKEY